MGDCVGYRAHGSHAGRMREWYWSSMRWVYEACGGIKTTDAVAVAVAVAVAGDDRGVRRGEGWRANARGVVVVPRARTVVMVTVVVVTWRR